MRANSLALRLFLSAAAWTGVGSPWPDRLVIHGTQARVEGDDEARRGLLKVRLTDALRFTICALTTFKSLMLRRSILKNKEAFLPSGPPAFMLNCVVSYPGCDVPGGKFSNGFRELKASVFPVTNTCPCNWSVPGFVRISILP